MTDLIAPVKAPASQPPPGSVWEVARLFLRLGLTAFGGPAAHIALFRNEIVIRRQWITDQHFLDLLGATNLIPGPNSTEMAIHIGYIRAGWRGLIAAGVCFIFPAFCIVLALAVLYMRYGTTPVAAWLLYGIKPVIIAIIAQAIWGLLRTAVKNRLLAFIGLAAFLLHLTGLHELLLMFGASLIYMMIHTVAQPGSLRELLPASRSAKRNAVGALLLALGGIGLSTLSFNSLFWIFLKIGSVLYGGGYVLVAFLRSDFVERLGWLTSQQLLDAIAIGQFTPGPLFTSATFVGYLVEGLPGAVLATIGIFLPAFVFVYLVHPFIPRLRQSARLGALLDGVNVAALGLMGAVALELGQSALVDGLTVTLAAITALLLIRFRVNSTLLIIGGAAVGLVYALTSGALAV